MKKIVFFCGLLVISFIAAAAFSWSQEQERERQFLTMRAETVLKSDSLKAGDPAAKLTKLFPHLANEISNGEADLTYYIPSKEEADPEYPHRLGINVRIYIREDKITFIKKERILQHAHPKENFLQRVLKR